MKNLRFAICDCRFEEAAARPRAGSAIQSQIENRKSKIRSAFTLIELMLSIALVLVLMVGINQVFKMTADTVGTGTAMLAVTRDRRDFQQTLNLDFANAMARPPLFMIKSERVLAYMDAQDLELDTDGDPTTVDLDGADTGNDGNFEGDPTVIGEVVLPSTYGQRNHRIDRIGFFTRGLTRSKTAPGTSAYDAYVWYGHLQLPNSDPGSVQYRTPGIGSPDPSAANYYRLPANNPNNFFAKQWLLGRVGMLIKDGRYDPDMPTAAMTTKTAPELVDGELAINRDEDADPGSILLSPIGWNSSTERNGTPTVNDYRVQFSLTDLANTTLDQFRRDVADASTVAALFWWGSLIYQTTDDPNNTRDYFAVEDPLSSTFDNFPFRYQCYPQRLVPADVPPLGVHNGVVRGWPAAADLITQFAVEFAGDFVTQNLDPADATDDANMRYGDVLDVGPDGVIDFIVVDSLLTPDPNDPAGKSSRVRWYGLPRDYDNDGQILGHNGARRNNELVDIIPVRDIVRLVTLNPVLADAGDFADYNGWANVGNTSLTPPVPPRNTVRFEREVPNIAPDYAAAGYFSSVDVTRNFRYTCVWTDAAPAMVRIITDTTDARGRLADLRPADTVYRIPQ